jgi:hypothetical protein
MISEYRIAWDVRKEPVPPNLDSFLLNTKQESQPVDRGIRYDDTGDRHHGDGCGANGFNRSIRKEAF